MAASASTRVRSSSDLPEPVAPISRPCGPMPSCADSLRSSSTGRRPAPTPIGTRSRSRCGRGRHSPGRRSNASGSPSAEQVGQARLGRRRAASAHRPPAASRSGGEPPGQRLGRRRRRAGRRSPTSALRPRPTTVQRVLRVELEQHGAPVAAGAAAWPSRSSTVTAVDAAVGSSVSSVPVRSPPSRTTTTCGPVRRPVRVRVEPRPAGQLVAEQPSRLGSGAGRPGGPGRARRARVGWRACGSHFTHSQSAAVRVRGADRTSRSSGRGRPRPGTAAPAPARGRRRGPPVRSTPRAGTGAARRAAAGRAPRGGW